jgi:hypothetical protein
VLDLTQRRPGLRSKGSGPRAAPDPQTGPRHTGVKRRQRASPPRVTGTPSSLCSGHECPIKSPPPGPKAAISRAFARCTPHGRSGAEPDRDRPVSGLTMRFGWKPAKTKRQRMWVDSARIPADLGTSDHSTPRSAAWPCPLRNAPTVEVANGWNAPAVCSKLTVARRRSKLAASASRQG